MGVYYNYCYILFEFCHNFDNLPKGFVCKEFQNRGVTVIAGGIHITADSEGAVDSFDAISVGMINRPIDHVIKDINALKTRHIMFIDDNFIGNPKWTKKLLKEIKPLKLKWNAAVTSNIVDMPEFISLPLILAQSYIHHY